MRRITLLVDPATLPPLPGTVWPDKSGAKLVLADGLNELTVDIDCRTREQALALARLLEDVARAIEEATA